MAQRAMVLRFNSISGTSNIGEMKINFTVNLLEEGVEGPRITDLEIITQWSDTANQMKTKITNAIVAEAQANGYTQITNGNNIIFPSFTKG